MKKELDKELIDKIMNRAIVLNRLCTEECRDFRIMVSPMRENTYLLRWTTIDVKNPDHPIQHYHYECFYPDGTSQNCSVNYDTQEEANEFFWSLETYYKQEYASDHKL